MEKREFKIIAVDFDGTLCQDCYPEIGEPNRQLISLLKDMKRNGSKIILWTCRTRDQLSDAVKWAMGQGLLFDAVNENVPEIIEMYGGNSRKIFADVYIDDKACFPWQMEEKQKME